MVAYQPLSGRFWVYAERLVLTQSGLSQYGARLGVLSSKFAREQLVRRYASTDFGFGMFFLGGLSSLRQDICS